MNDDLFDQEIHSFAEHRKGTEIQYHRQVPLSDGFKVVLKILPTGRIIIFYRPGDSVPNNRIGHWYIDNDESSANSAKPYSFVMSGGAVTRERLYETIMAESHDTFEWVLWNLT